MATIRNDELRDYWQTTANKLVEIEAKLNTAIDVADADAHAELALMKAELEAIKTKLSGTLTTQLTGSNVELATYLNFPVTAGSTVFTQTTGIDVTDFTHVVITIRADSTHNFIIGADFTNATYTFGTAFLRRNTTISNHSLGTTGHVELLTGLCRATIKNDDVVDHFYDVLVRGVKR